MLINYQVNCLPQRPYNEEKVTLDDNSKKCAEQSAELQSENSLDNFENLKNQ